MMRSILQSSLLAVLCAAAVPAWAVFSDNGDGTVTDSITGLIWNRCSVGQTWSSNTCNGTAGTFTWRQALQQATMANSASHLGQTDWRLPNRTELESLVNISAQSPAIDTTAFPNTAKDWYWTSTTYASHAVSAWYVDFDRGVTNALAKYEVNTIPVRLVRSGQRLGAFDAQVNYAITASANPAPGGTVTCTPSPANQGGSSTCSVTSTNPGYTFSGWSGDCTGAGACSFSNITAAKNVTANFTLNTYTITTAASPAAGGTVTCTPNPVPHGSSSTCSMSANLGYTLANWSGDCTGSSCSLTNVMAPQSVTAWLTQQWSGLSLPEGPQAGQPLGLALQPGQGWQITQASTATTASLGAPPPAGVALPQGVLKLRLEHGAAGTAATVVLTFPQALPAGTVYYKFGRTADNATPHWYAFAGAAISGNTITLTLTDGGAGDDDGAANSVIDDPGGPAVPVLAVAPIPTLSQWMMAMLAGLLVLGALRVQRPGR